MLKNQIKELNLKSNISIKNLNFNNVNMYIYITYIEL